MRDPAKLIAYLADYQYREEDNLSPVPGPKSVAGVLAISGAKIPVFTNEFWTSRQRQAASIHEISYRACFKPQLPRFFIRLLTEEGDTVYDPFSGRGTTAIEAALLGRKVIANDVNPLSTILCQPRLAVPEMDAVQGRLAAIPLQRGLAAEMDLSMFFHPATLAELLSLRCYLQQRRELGLEDEADRWIRMVATNRLTGHSRGFFSVYTLPPNQATAPENQVKINQKRKQQPDYRDVKRLILKKSSSLLRTMTREDMARLRRAAATALFLEADARHTAAIQDSSVQLTVTSPPFLNVVQYSRDNWLRCWFNGIEPEAIDQKITMAKTVEEWSAVMGAVFEELYRITRPGGWVAFEVGEVRRGRIRLEEAVIPLGLKAGFRCLAVLINRQKFTKTANIWGIKNNTAGTNTNRIVLFFKA